MNVTSSNPKRSGAIGKVTFVGCDSSLRISVSLKCSNVKRTVKANPDLLQELKDVAAFINTADHKNPMMRIFRECKARVDVHRYFNNMPKSIWAQSES